MFQDRQHYSTCWPRVCTAPHEMLVCTLAFLRVWLLWTKRKSLLYNSEIYWEWNTLTPGVERCHLCKQSKAMYEAESIHRSCLRESKRNDFPLCRKRKGQNGHHFVMETSAQQSWVSHHEADIFVQAWWNSFCGNLATCYSLCDTNILHYELRHFRYWTPLSRPSLTHRLITLFLYIYKIFKKQFISLHMTSQISSCTKRKKKEKKRKCYLLKSIVSFHCGLQVKKTQVKAICEISGKQI